MKKFLLQISAFIILLLVVCFIGKKLFPDKPGYNGAFVEKLKILQQHKDVRKIVLLGGSGTGWGISAKMIEDSLGIPTLNLGHHAGYGLLDFQKFVIEQLTKDDIIIFCPEWEFYENPEFHDKALLNDLITKNTEYGTLLNNTLYQIRSYIPFPAIKVATFLPKEQNTPYRFDCFNANGDIVSQCSMLPKGPVSFGFRDSTFSLSNFENHFPFLQTTKTFIVFPPTQARVFAKNKTFFLNIERALAEKKYTVLDSVTDNVYPETSFFDLQYHLTCEVRAERTAHLIPKIRALIQPGR